MAQLQAGAENDRKGDRCGVRYPARKDDPAHGAAVRGRRGDHSSEARADQRCI
uniref:Uncharacterized protein n=1 Tax=Siphoviridae sp. ctrvp54 TaxID=2825690 RepID=A0A8S5P9H9_9CAUD|nr:MAG TPA: hypothetical protein [Siphoviridae sp. ctrvp54]